MRPAPRAASCAAPRRSEGPSRVFRRPGSLRTGYRGTRRLRSRPDTGSERCGVDLPAVAVDPARPDDVLGTLERRHRAEGALPVDDERLLLAVGGQLELLPGDPRQLDDLDPPPGDRPEAVSAANGLGAVGRLQLLLERLREAPDLVRPLLDHQVAARERDEVGALAGDLRRLERDDGVPLADAVEAVDAGCVPRRPRLRLLERDAALAREADVERLAPPEQRHVPLWCAVRRRGSSV